jgi:hypothetical protein
MPKRPPAESDNEWIDDLSSPPTPSHGSPSGGNLQRSVGKRDELRRASDPDNREPVIGSDNPKRDAQKGRKTMQAIKKGKAN